MDFNSFAGILSNNPCSFIGCSIFERRFIIPSIFKLINSTNFTNLFQYCEIYQKSYHLNAICIVRINSFDHSFHHFFQYSTQCICLYFYKGWRSYMGWYYRFIQLVFINLYNMPIDFWVLLIHNLKIGAFRLKYLCSNIGEQAILISLAIQWLDFYGIAIHRFDFFGNIQLY